MFVGRVYSYNGDKSFGQTLDVESFINEMGDLIEYFTKKVKDGDICLLICRENGLWIDDFGLILPDGSSLTTVIVQINNNKKIYYHDDVKLDY